MKCTEIRELLPDLATGFAPAAPEVNNHLRGCGDCSGALADYRKTMALLDEWQAPEPSPYFDVRLKARLREEAAVQPRSWLAWLRHPVLAVSMALVLVAGVTMIQVERTHNTNSGPPVAKAEPGTAVGDLQELDRNHDLFSDSDPDSAASLLDDIQVQQDTDSNP